ncbi:MAG: hypothetical protein PHY54_00550 [Methylococcales bacterium]|nr:hypothetical protein [Methylococcales bacterium]
MAVLPVEDEVVEMLQSSGLPHAETSFRYWGLDKTPKVSRQLSHLAG